MQILVVEDNRVCRDLLQQIIADNGWSACLAADGLTAHARLEEAEFEAVIVDLNIPHSDGFEILRRVRSGSPRSKVILLSGSLGVAETVRAMQMGAYCCMAKPFNAQELVDLLKRVEASFVMTLSAQTPEVQDEMVAVSIQMRRTNLLLANIAKSRATTVLITGETGTGKEVVARRLHQISDRRAKPFVAVNCSAVPPSLIESELFGHERGAFTDAKLLRKGFFELAGDGTIFLDEIGDLAPESQGKLLRVLQERRFRRVGGGQELSLHARVVAATNVDLAAAVRQGKFREDLFYRLAVIPIHLAPLRERVVDILPLAEHFIQHFSHEFGSERPQLSDEQKRLLLSHIWHGNVRELRNVIERFVLMGGHLEFISSALKDESKSNSSATPAPLEQASTAVDGAERKLMYEVLVRKLFKADPSPATSTAALS